MAPTKSHNIKLKHAIYMCNYGFSSVKLLSQKKSKVHHRSLNFPRRVIPVHELLKYVITIPKLSLGL